MKKWAVRLWLLVSAIGLLGGGIAAAFIVLPIMVAAGKSLREAWRIYAAALVSIAFDWLATWRYPNGVPA